MGINMVSRFLLWVCTVLNAGIIHAFSAQNGETSGSLSGGITGWILSLFPAYENMALQSSCSFTIRCRIFCEAWPTDLYFFALVFLLPCLLKAMALNTQITARQKVLAFAALYTAGTRRQLC